MKNKKTYAEKRAEAIRELKHLRPFLLSKSCTIELINRAYNLKIKYNL